MFGIRPSHPATGFGYIEAGELCAEVCQTPVYRVRRFVMTIWGPPQLDDDHDPLVRLARQRAERYAARARRIEADA